MDKDSKFIIRKVAIDFVLLLCVGFPILFFYLWGKPVKRGFFCDDESLRHPYHESTVANIWLYIIGVGLPVLTMLLTEFFVNKDSQKTFYLFGLSLPEWVWCAYCSIGVFGFGAACSQLTTDIAKYNVGRLRPHFFAVCQPNVNCSLSENQNRYIEDFTCLGTNANQIREMRLSFPSGHSSFSAYAMIYLSIYLQSRMTWKGSKLLRHFIQYILVMMCWYTALTRISDYKHHWSDVLSGGILGIIVAFLISKYVSNLFSRQQQSYIPTSSDMDTELAGQQMSSNGMKNV